MKTNIFTCANDYLIHKKYYAASLSSSAQQVPSQHLTWKNDIRVNSITIESLKKVQK